VWGLDHTLTLDHYVRAFSVTLEGGLAWSGVAWNSFWTTMKILEHATVERELAPVAGAGQAIRYGLGLTSLMRARCEDRADLAGL
jgi:hypothetical protein